MCVCVCLCVCQIKRRLQESLSDEIFLSVNGNTDSEWAFAVFLSQLQCPRQCEPFGHETLKEAMLNTIRKFNMWFKSIEKTANNGLTPSMLNFAVTDGVSVVCTRYINSSSAALEPERLYFSSGTRFECYKPGHYRMVKEAAKVKREDIVMIASEPLTFEETDWRLVSRNTLVVITGRMNVLMYPIKDDYYGCSSIKAQQQYNHFKSIESTATVIAQTSEAPLLAIEKKQIGLSKGNRPAGFVVEPIRAEAKEMTTIVNANVGLRNNGLSSPHKTDVSVSNMDSILKNNGFKPSLLQQSTLSLSLSPLPSSPTLHQPTLSIAPIASMQYLDYDAKKYDEGKDMYGHGMFIGFPRRDSGNAEYSSEGYNDLTERKEEYQLKSIVKMKIEF